jgi:hypothetical protein
MWVIFGKPGARPAREARRADLLGEGDQVVSQLVAGVGCGHPPGEPESESSALKRCSTPLVAGVWVGGADQLVDQPQNPLRQAKTDNVELKTMAERVGFEPTIELPL